jgi:hypothetical protein
MNSSGLLLLANVFVKQVKLADTELDASETLQNIVADLFPYVTDNIIENIDGHNVITIDLSREPYYTSDRETLSEEEFQKLIEFTANILHNSFRVHSIRFEEIPNGEGTSVIAKLAR